MQKVIFETGQRIIKAVLDHLQDGKEQSDRDRRNDFSDPGLLDDVREIQLSGSITFTNGSLSVTGAGSLFTTELKPGDKITDDSGSFIGTVDSIIDDSNLDLTTNWDGTTGVSTAAKRRIDPFNIRIGDNNNPPTTHSINIEAGVAYDSNGERIEIPDPITPHDPSAPSATSTDGKGGTVSTPQSTGSQNIVLTANSNNFIWLDYLGVRDTSIFTLQKATNAIQYFKQLDGFQITVTTTDTAPNSTSLKLGNVDLTGGGVVSPSTIDTTGRIFSGLSTKRQKIELPKSDRSDATPVSSYIPGTEAFLQDHIKAVGTGTISNTNPHGLQVEDLGFDPEESLEQHQQFLHTTGIVGDRTSTTSSLYLELTTVSPGEDFVTIKPLTSSEVAQINGRIIDSADIPTDTTLLFSSSVDGTGTYYVFIDKSIKQVQRSNVDPSSDPNKILLWSFTWTADPGGSPQDGNISAIVDHRSFNTTVTPILGVDGTVSEPTYSFNSEPTTGVYHPTTGEYSLAIQGNQRYNFTNNQLLTSGQSASNSTPSIANISDPDTGFLWLSGSVNHVVDGIQAMNVSATQVGVRDGSVGLPGLTFNNENTTGFYRPTSGIVGVAGTLRVSDGTAASPAIGFEGDTDTGMYHIGTDVLGFSTASTERLRLTTSVTQSSGNYHGPDGSTSAPAFAFTNDTDTGMYRVSANAVGLTASSSQIAQISTSGIQVKDGSGYAFLSDANIGMRRSAPGELTFRTGSHANPVIFQNSGQAIFNVGIEEAKVADGSAADPKFTFQNDTDTGFYRVTSNVIGVATGANDVARFEANNTNLQGRRFYLYRRGVNNSLPSNTGLGTFDTKGAPAFIYAVAYAGGNYQSMRVYMALHQQAGPSSHIIQIHEHHAGFDNINRADIYIVNTSTPGRYEVLVSQFTTSGITWAVYGDEGN